MKCHEKIAFKNPPSRGSPFRGLSMTAFAASLQAEEGEEATGTTKLKVVVKNAENGRFSYLMDMDAKKFKDGATLTTGEMY